MHRMLKLHFKWSESQWTCNRCNSDTTAQKGSLWFSAFSAWRRLFIAQSQTLNRGRRVNYCLELHVRSSNPAQFILYSRRCIYAFVLRYHGKRSSSYVFDVLSYSVSVPRCNLQYLIAWHILHVRRSIILTGCAKSRWYSTTCVQPGNKCNGYAL